MSRPVHRSTCSPSAIPTVSCGIAVVPAEHGSSRSIPVFIIIFGSLFSAIWIALARRHRDPSTGMKFIFGLVGVAAGFAVMAAASRLVVNGHKVGMGWLSVTYLLHTWGELCLSPVGLSAVTKLVPSRFCGQSLGIFFVSLSLGKSARRPYRRWTSMRQIRAAMPGQIHGHLLVLRPLRGSGRSALAADAALGGRSGRSDTGTEQGRARR